MKKLKVGLINTEQLGYWTGSVSIFVYNQAKLLRNRGHEVHLFVKDTTPLPNNLHGIKLHFIKFNKDKKVSFFELIKSGFKKDEVCRKNYVASLTSEIDKCYNSGSIDLLDFPEFCGEGADIAMEQKIPMLLRINYSNFLDGHFFGTNKMLEDVVEREKIMIKSSRSCAYPCDWVYKKYSEFLGFSPAVRENIPVPFEMMFFSDRDMGKSTVVDSDITKILFVGRFSQKKGLTGFLNLINMIPQQMYDDGKIGFTVLGGENEEFVKDVQEAQKSGKKVVYEKFVSRPKLLDYYKSHDIVIFPHLHESFSYSLAEAMSCAKTVVVSDKTGNSEYIKDGFDGFVFKNGDWEHLYTIISSLCQKKNTMRYIGKNAVATIRKCFDYDRIYKKTVSIYDKTYDIYGKR